GGETPGRPGFGLPGLAAASPFKRARRASPLRLGRLSHSLWSQAQLREHVQLVVIEPDVCRQPSLVPPDQDTPDDNPLTGRRDAAPGPDEQARVSALEGELLHHPRAADELVLSRDAGAGEAIE